MKLSLSLLCLLCAPLCAATGSIQDLIDAAVRRGESRITLPPGEHRLATALQLERLEGVTLEGAGATLVFTNLKDGGISVDDCRELTLRGFTVDFDPLPFTQGTITAIDRAKGSVAFSLHEGYPALGPDYEGTHAHVFDPATRAWKKNAPDLYASEARQITPRTGELTFSSSQRWQLESLSPGDFIVKVARGGRGIRIENSSNILVDGVKMWSAPGIAMTCRFMDGLNRFSYTIARGPTPAGATEPRLLSTSADGFNYAYARTGPILEKCNFSFMGDDAVNLHGIAFVVGEANGDTIRLVRPYGRENFGGVVRPGDAVRSLAQGNFDLTGTARVVSFGAESTADPRLVKLAGKLFPKARRTPGTATVYTLRLSAPLPVGEGDFIEIPALAAPGYLIRDNHFFQNRGRGLRLESSHGLVENNLVEGIKQAAITLGPEFVGFREAGWIDDVTVRGNTIRDCGFDPLLQRAASYTPGAISVFHRGEAPDSPLPIRARHQNILIENNTITGVGGPAIHINQAAHVRIIGNAIADTNQVAPSGQRNLYGLTTDLPVEVNNSENVVIEPRP